MKKEATLISLKESSIVISYKNKKQSFDSMNFDVTLLRDSSMPLDGFNNRVFVSRDLYDKTGSLCFLFNSENNQYTEVFCVSDDNLTSETIKASPRVFNNLGIDINSDMNCSLVSIPKPIFNKAKTIQADKISNDVIYISEKDSKDILNVYLSAGFYLFELTNMVTGKQIIINRHHLQVNDKLNKGEIQMGRTSRLFLGLEIEDVISDFIWSTIIDKIDHASSDYQKIIKVYDETKHFLISDSDFNDISEAKRVLSKYIEKIISLQPVLDSFKKKTGRNFGNTISDFYVGRSTTNLICSRPYDIDEGKDIVRIPKTVMSLLGISEMDRVRLYFKTKSYKANVLALDDESLYSKNNHSSRMDVSIGIPAHIRKHLGIENLECGVKIDRDTGFLFRKNMNEHIVPALVTLFTSNFITSFSPWKTAIMTIILTPFVVYFDLSPQRNQRLK